MVHLLHRDAIWSVKGIRARCAVVRIGLTCIISLGQSRVHLLQTLLLLGAGELRAQMFILFSQASQYRGITVDVMCEFRDPNRISSKKVEKIFTQICFTHSQG